MTPAPPLLPSQRVAQICLFLIAVIATLGGCLQLYLGQPETTPRLDNVHRFLGGVYLGSAPIAFWAAATIRRQTTLVFLIGFTVLLGGTGRLISMTIVGLPEPHALWLGYLTPELALPFVMFASQLITNRRQAANGLSAD